jgi:hypothetical protein
VREREMGRQEGEEGEWAAGSAGLGEEKERWAATEMGDGLDTEKGEG